MNKTFLAWLLVPVALFGKNIPITLEHANDPYSRSWGLMGRASLAENHGLLLAYERPIMMSIWMFNVNMDLDIAFVDTQGVIQEIRSLKAYPDVMDPKRPVKTLKDIDLYPHTDPIRVFFTNNSVKSAKPARYGLEMNKGWFRKNEVGVGDKIQFTKGTPEATIVTTQ